MCVAMPVALQKLISDELSFCRLLTKVTAACAGIASAPSAINVPISLLVCLFACFILFYCSFYSDIWKGIEKRVTPPRQDPKMAQNGQTCLYGQSTTTCAISTSQDESDLLSGACPVRINPTYSPPPALPSRYSDGRTPTHLIKALEKCAPLA